jgi:hypothetical protein
VILAALGAVLVLLLLVVLLLVRRTRRLARRLDSLTRDAEGHSLEGVLEAHLDKVFAVSRELDDMTVRTAALETAHQATLQRVGLVRFNPFEDTGGNQSFALALLDLQGNGVVVSSLHARTGTRVYGKAISGGRADTALSDEEAEALRQALASTTPGRSGS